MLALNIRGMVASQGMPAYPEAGRGQEQILPTASGGSWALLTPQFGDFGPVVLIGTSALQNCERISFCGFKLPHLWESVPAATRN